MKFIRGTSKYIDIRKHVSCTAKKTDFVSTSLKAEHGIVTTYFTGNETNDWR